MKQRPTATLLAAALVLALFAGCAPSDPAAGAPASPETSASAAPSTGTSAAPSEEPSAEPSGTPAPSEPPVYTDWSQLETSEPPEPIWHYAENYCGEKLAAGSGYGVLLPYVGGTVTADGEDAPLYGLTDRSGGIVTDATYADAQVWDSFLTLFDDESIRTLAALDGSWVMSGVDLVRILDGYAILWDNEKGLSFVRPDGSVAAEVSRRAIGEFFGDENMVQFYVYDTMNFECVYDEVAAFSYESDDDAQILEGFIYLSTGEISSAPPEGYPKSPVYMYNDAPETFPGYIGAAYAFRDPATRILYYTAYTEDDGMDILDEDGKVLWRCGSASTLLPPVLDGTIAFTGGTWFSRYDLATGECIFRCAVRSNDD